MTMQLPIQRTFHSRKICLLLSVAVFVFALPARAELGANVSSIQADQAKLKGSVRVTSAANYQIHEIQTGQGSRVREYVSSSGTVFAVAWQGQSTPDLHQLLGQYFDQYLQAAQSTKTGRGPKRIALPNLVVERGGHMRYLVGRAYLPQMIPQGVTSDEIK